MSRVVSWTAIARERYGPFSKLSQEETAEFERFAEIMRADSERRARRDRFYRMGRGSVGGGRRRRYGRGHAKRQRLANLGTLWRLR